MCTIQQSVALIAEWEEFPTSLALRHNSCSWHGIWWECLKEVWQLKGCQGPTSHQVPPTYLRINTDKKKNLEKKRSVQWQFIGKILVPMCSIIILLMNWWIMKGIFDSMPLVRGSFISLIYRIVSCCHNQKEQQKKTNTSICPHISHSSSQQAIIKSH